MSSARKSNRSWPGVGRAGREWVFARLAGPVLSESFVVFNPPSNRGGGKGDGEYGAVSGGAKMIAKLNFQFYFPNEKFKSNCAQRYCSSPSHSLLLPSGRVYPTKIFIAYKLLLRFVFICSTSFQLEVCKSRAS